MKDGGPFVPCSVGSQVCVSHDFSPVSTHYTEPGMEVVGYQWRGLRGSRVRNWAIRQMRWERQSLSLSLL